MKRVWGDTRRSEVGERHRRPDSQADVPTGDYEEDADNTKPIQLLELDPNEPLTVASAIVMWERIDRVKSDAKRRESPAARLNAIDFRMKIVWGLLVGALTLAGASFWSVVKFVYAKAGDDRETELTIKRLVEQHSEISGRVRNVEDISTRSAQRLDDINQRVK
jgi:hypothetical protein